MAARSGNLITAKFPEYPLIDAIRRRLRQELEPFIDDMKAGVAEGTQPNSPSWWIGNIQSYIQIEDLGGGGGMIIFGLGLIDGTPEQALWQAYIFNSGSGPVFSVAGSYYNVNTGANEKGGAPPFYEHVNWGKGANHWFDNVADKLTSGTLMSIMERVVKAAVQELFARGVWQIKGHSVSIKI